MLAPIDVPDHLLDLAQRSKNLSRKIADALAESGEEHVLPHGADLMEHAPAYVFVSKGFFKCHEDGKLIRYYGDGDLIALESREHSRDCRLLSEFGSKVTVWANEAAARGIGSDRELAETWLAWQETEVQLMRSLCAVYAEEEGVPNIETRSFEPGQMIVLEGDEPDKVLLMADGRAEVTMRGHRVGEVNPDEVFGEVSFFAGKPRTATVTARTSCLVQCLDYEDFLKLIPRRPQLMAALTTSLAKRIMELNEKVAGE